MPLFDAVAEEYEAGRPGYPASLYDALEPLAGATVLEGGAGTGIATAPMLRRGARVFPFDIGLGVLTRMKARIPDVPAVVADGAAMPFRDACADLLCFAQSWHWLDDARRVSEAARVLRRGGRWAGWWSHARADGEPWFERYWDAIEAATVARREHRDIDWGDDLRRSAAFDVGLHMTFKWLRKGPVGQWLQDERSKSYIASLPDRERQTLLKTIDDLIRDSFPSGEMRVPYETWLWVAARV